MPKQICEISESSWFYYKKSVTIHGHMNVKLPAFCLKMLKYNTNM